MTTKTTSLRRWTLKLLPMVFLGLLAGCGFNPSDVVLTGTWKMTTDSDAGSVETLVTFDQNNRVSQISFTVGKVTATYDNLNQNTKIRGDSVVIDSTFLGNGLVVDGIINSDQTVITATVTIQIQLPSVKVSINNSQAILRKQ